eukprot:jgi/Phyca11/551952/estExt2_Genewise1Plus.C_PHYCAscaffold_440275
MSYASKTTTNNQAENLGLLIGLRACVRYQWSPLHVIGDSQLIIRQHRTGTPPKASHLLGLYWQSRRLADLLPVASWTHHKRRFNRMADTLANIAMDNRRSVQTTPSAMTSNLVDLDKIHEQASSDIGHWRYNRNDESSLELGAFPV